MEAFNDNRVMGKSFIPVCQLVGTQHIHNRCCRQSLMHTHGDVWNDLTAALLLAVKGDLQ